MDLKAELYLGDIGEDIVCPFFDKAGTLHLVLQNSGEVISVSPTGLTDLVHSTNGQPNGAAFDSQGVMYVADFAHCAVLAVQPSEGQQDVVVAVYEDKPLKGPNSIFVTGNGSIFFTDSGPLGETGLHCPVGSVYAIVNSLSGQILKPISLGNLAHPTGIVVSSDGQFVYVAETMRNRIVRYFQQPEGVYHGSVFYQLSGGVGPMSLAIDANDRLYVGQYDVCGSGLEGSVYVIAKSGKLLSTVSVAGPEISGLAIREKNLFITEKSTKSVYRASIR